MLGRLIIFTEVVWKARIGITTQVYGSETGQLLDIGPHILGPKRAVDSDAEKFDVGNGIPERLNRLPGERAATCVCHRDRSHNRNPSFLLVEILVDREECRLAVQS